MPTNCLPHQHPVQKGPPLPMELNLIFQKKSFCKKKKKKKKKKIKKKKFFLQPGHGGSIGKII
jgi:hypothetical protein